MTIRLKTLLVSTFAIFWLNASAQACLCYRFIEANNSTGQVLVMPKRTPYYKTEPNYDEPIPKASIILSQPDETDNKKYKIVVEIKTDENGRFSLKGIKPGIYQMDVGASDYNGVSFELKITGNSIYRKDNIVIGLSTDRNCCGGYVKAEVGVT